MSAKNLLAFASRQLCNRLNTLLLIDQEMNVGVDRDDDHVGQHVDSANNVQHIGILERDSLGYLHHPKDDNQVGAA